MFRARRVDRMERNMMMQRAMKAPPPGSHGPSTPGAPVQSPFGNTVVQSPKALLDDSIHPKTNVGDFYHLKMRQQVLGSRQNDSYGIAYAQNGQPFEADIQGKNFSIKDKMILCNRSNQEIGIILKNFGLRTTYTIYGFHPAKPGQEPSKTKHNNRQLYKFAEVVDLPMSFDYTIQCEDGTVYRAEVAGGRLVGRRQMRVVKDRQMCALVGEERMMAGNFRGQIWDVKIAPGADPLMMIAFVAILEECLERGRR